MPAPFNLVLLLLLSGCQMAGSAFEWAQADGPLIIPVYTFRW